MKQLKLFLKDKRTWYDTAVLEFLTEEKDALTAKPGMFFMLEAGTLLKKPISVLDVDSRSGMLKFLIRRIGKGTSFLYDLKPGAELTAVGPSGNSFPNPGARPVLLVGGGSGIPPMFFLSRNSSTKPFHVVYGGRSREDIMPLFGKSVPHRITTDDGSLGLKGTVVKGVRKIMKENPEFKNALLFSCGPEPMVQALTRAFPYLDHFTSLERYMGCGFGVCLGCVVQTVNGMKRVCVDGPVFNTKDLGWNNGHED
ncbi:MAG: dihydroorotate dehydrogenase electron transfer subunit [Acidobacteria bacterium CG_4_9_14_3_um_filter_49_7]|nr:MAG: dihydroorotate dehydrogenase electron transfer subunit [Acidobacteria bacterium CG_4_9_14_3_um_filter_49_7]